MAAATAELRQLLKEDQNGKNLYDHLTETLMKIMIERPKNAFDSFESISAHVKANPLNPDPLAGRELPPSAAQLDKQLAWTKNSAALLKVPEEAPEDGGVKVPDVMEDFNLLNWAGVSFARGDQYRAFLSIKKLAEGLPAETEKLRFFGKITTRGLPYYIVEGLSSEDEEGAVDTKQEGRNGANKYNYWVTQNIESAQWTKLPNVTMEQVVAARQFKRFFTGDLNAEVPSYPPFAGKENSLLRTQIALIAGATSISPDGFYDLNEDDPPAVVPAEAEAMNERFPKSSGDLKDPESWKHHETELNKIGRITAMPEQLDDNGEPIEPEEPVELTPTLDTVKPENWAFRVSPGGAGVSGNSVVTARSLQWPGAVAVAAGRRYVNFYVGNGVAYSKDTYSPPMIAPVQTEWVPAEEGAALVENNDVRVDPTPPAPEGEVEEE